MHPLIVAAPASGCGKSSVMLGLLGALVQRKVAVAPFKVGPDFIDPGHHTAISGRTSRNLDSWMCTRETVREIFARGCLGADLAVVEGVMGLFDGADGATDAGSTAQIARWLGGKILLVVDARAQARSAAAVVKGFTTFAVDLEFAGVIYNRVGSVSHARILSEAHEATAGLPPLLGCLSREERLVLPERHLGLVTAAEVEADPVYRHLARWVTESIDLDRLLTALAGSLPDVPRPCPTTIPRSTRPVRIGLARDAAFCFIYPENLELLEQAGAELVPFSPLAGNLPAGLDGLYLPGGYPEVHVDTLAANRPFLGQLRVAADGGLPIYAECGGLLLLATSLDGVGLGGVFPAVAHLRRRHQGLGYREITMTTDTPLGPAGTVARGHEFHYSELSMPRQIVRAYHVCDRNGASCGHEGYLKSNVLGSYIHLHFASNPQLAENFVARCRAWRDQRQ